MTTTEQVVRYGRKHGQELDSSSIAFTLSLLPDAAPAAAADATPSRYCFTSLF